MHCYGMNYQEVMAMPIRAFWFVSGCVERLQAGHDRRALVVANHAAGQESAQELMERLAEQSPEPVKLTVEAVIEASSQRDEAGVSRLKAMASGLM